MRTGKINGGCWNKMEVYIGAYNTICSLGFSASECYNKMTLGETGVKIVEDKSLSEEPFPLSRIDDERLNKELKTYTDNETLSRFEKIMLLSAQKTLEASGIDPADQRTLFVLSTTKGNVSLLENDPASNRVNLWHSARMLKDYFKNPNKAQTISNACISGVAAIILGQRLIHSGAYDHVVVVGADVVSKFIVSGFQSFKSLSPQVCRPFDKDRDGLTLGEGAASLILTNKKDQLDGAQIEVVSGSISNDANHISGPSRTGEGLYLAIQNTLRNLDISPDFIQAHGTATPYNDDMESKAIFRSNLSEAQVNSFKGYFGHTLGAAGLIETIMGIESLKNNTILGTYGYRNFGVAENITIAKDTITKNVDTMLKLASGFGGCNAALLIRKNG